jgi:FkbM family methyltransferase
MLSRLKPRVRKLGALADAALHDPRRRGLDLTFVDPCYWLINRVTRDSVILDFGLGCDADFSQAMIARFGLTSHGYDPTRRHHPELRKVAGRSNGRFVLHEAAIGVRPGTLTFHESKDNVSGSLSADHPNIRHDRTESYEVRVVTVPDAIAATPNGRADLVKMDIEGPEYDVLNSLSDEVIRSVPQWLVDFHHDLLPGVTFAHTRAVARRFRALGFGVYSRDAINVLFYRP